MRRIVCGDTSSRLSAKRTDDARLQKATERGAVVRLALEWHEELGARRHPQLRPVLDRDAGRVADDGHPGWRLRGRHAVAEVLGRTHLRRRARPAARCLHGGSRLAVPSKRCVSSGPGRREHRRSSLTERRAMAVGCHPLAGSRGMSEDSDPLLGHGTWRFAALYGDRTASGFACGMCADRLESRRSFAPEAGDKRCRFAGVFSGSDGTRTRDLRRDRPVMALPG